MLHELLFALYGCPGNIFTETDNGIKISKGIKSFSVAEVAILEKLCVLGTEFRLFQDFLREHDGLGANIKGKVCGMYLKAFCSGLDSVLDQYRKDLTKLEKNILEDPLISLFQIQHVLEKYFLLFPALNGLLNDIRKTHGCKILSLVCCHSGIPIVSEAYNKILQTCHKPFLKHLIAWMIYGRLLDPYEEFFIHKIKQREISDFEKVTTEKFSQGHNMGEFELKLDLLPSYISIDVATKILFVGSSVCLFGNNQQELKTTSSMFAEKEDYFSKAIYNLQEGEFSVIDFKTAVDEIRVSAAEHLWKIVVQEGKLLSHLYCLKDFYLLGRGELFLTFIDNAGHLLDAPPSETTEWEVNRSFRAAVNAVLSEDDNVSEKFSLTVKVNENAQVFRKESAVSGWSSIGLSFDVKWPLHTILNPGILEKYNKIFRFLLSIRQVQKELHQCWMLKMKAKGGVRYSQNTLWQLLTNVTFLVDNIQYYLQNDVLESQFSHLIEIVKSKKDFEVIIHAHETFLSSVMTLSFITWVNVHKVLVDVMAFCRKLCKYIWTLHDGVDQELISVADFSEDIRRLTSALFMCLSVANKSQGHTNLGILLLKLDYNKYFGTIGHLGI